MDILKDLGELAIGSRLRRLSDQMMNDVKAINKNFGIDFNPKWFPVFYTLVKHEKLAIMELSEQLNITHPAVIKLAKELQKEGYIDSEKDTEDRRKRYLKLSEKGRALLPELELAWKDMAKGGYDLLQNKQNNLLHAIQEVEYALREKSFFHHIKEARIERMLKAIKIVDYDPKYVDEFKKINYNWIEKYFKVEQADIEALDGHQEKILNKGGYIYFAMYENEIAGTCALIKYSDERYELAKMGVKDKFKGIQIGKKLGLTVIAKVRALGGKVLFLESNKSLKPALNLYTRLGFKEIPMIGGSVSDYERADIKMEIRF